MSSKLNPLLKQLKHLAFEKAQIRLFFLKRRLVDRKLAVTVFEPEVTPELAARLARSVKARLEKANTIADYAPLTVDQDDGLLVAKPDSVNWQAIHGKIKGEGRAVKAAKGVEDLKDCDFYVTEFDFNQGQPLYAAKRLPEKLSLNRLKFEQWRFCGGKLDALDQEKVFNVAMGVDFLSWDGHVFVVEKRVFESIMNIREGMTRKRDELLTALEGLQKFDGLAALKTAIGDNAHMLRRATQIAEAKNYSDQKFVEKLFEVIQQWPGWGIEIKEGKILVTPQNSDGVLSLLNDARAESLIRRQVFDAVVKKPVS